MQDVYSLYSGPTCQEEKSRLHSEPELTMGENVRRSMVFLKPLAPAQFKAFAASRAL